MKTASRRTSPVPSARRGAIAAGHVLGPLLRGLYAAGLAAGLLWLVWVYGNGLRDPRYLDGWLLAGGMGLQLYLYTARKLRGPLPRSDQGWRKVHILVGYVLIVLFLAHSDFSLPETSLEWALSGGFLLVALSGVFGTYLAWSLKTKRSVADGIAFDRISALRAGLADEVHAMVYAADQSAPPLPLPQLPHEDWIKNLYESRLHEYFQGPRNYTAHLIGSRIPFQRMCDEIDNLSQYVDRRGQAQLAAIKDLVREKDQLDFARVHLGLTRTWLLVHVPVTFALIVLTLLHVVIVYSFASGAG